MVASDVILIVGVLLNVATFVALVWVSHALRKANIEAHNLYKALETAIDKITYLDERRRLLVRRVADLGGDPYAADLDPSTTPLGPLDAEAAGDADEA